MKIKKAYIISGVPLALFLLAWAFCPKLNAAVELPPLDNLSSEQSYKLGQVNALLEAATYIKRACKMSHIIVLQRVDKDGKVVKRERYSCYPIMKVSNPIRIF